MKEIYLDHAATTPVRPEVVAVMVEHMTVNYGNPSSPHAKGVAAEAAVRRAREQVANALGVTRDEIVFTSGGTESNNLVIKGVAAQHQRRGGSLVCLSTEHPSVLEAMRDLATRGSFVHRTVPVDGTGVVDLPALREQVNETTLLVSVAYVNNEIGTIQPIEQIVAAVREKNPHTVIHVDAVQALGKVPVQPRKWGVDAVSLSGHKIHGPKGIGAVYVRRGLRLHALLHGGQQEFGLRSGTENVPGIAGFGEAVTLAVGEMEELSARWRKLRHVLYDRLSALIPGTRVIGPALDDAAPHILNVSVPDIKGEVLVRMLGDGGLYVSTGSACSTKRRAVSHVLTALGLDATAIDSALRISFGRGTTEEQVVEAANRIAEARQQLVAWQV